MRHLALTTHRRAALAILVAVLACASLAGVESAAADPGMGTVVVQVGETTGSYISGFCADIGVPASGTILCSDGQPPHIQTGLSGGGTTAVSLPAGGYTAALAAGALGVAGPVVVLDEQTIVCTFTMAAAPACALAPGSGPGTVVVQVGETTGSYISGFCAVPGLPQEGTLVCTDDRAVILQSGLVGGGSLSVSLPAGRYTAALAAVGSTTLGAIGPVRVLGGQTIVCQFTMAAAPACAPAPGSGPGTVVVHVDVSPGGDFAAGFCAVPGVPVAGTVVCSDGHTAEIASPLAGGATRAVSLPAGYYMAALGRTSPPGLSPSGPIVVLSGRTLVCSFTMAAPPACGPATDDGDGVTEPPAGLPESYDGNGDTVPDVYQGNVASFVPAVGSAPVTIASPGGTILTGVTTSPVPVSPAPPAGATYPVGVLGFTLQLAPGQTSADVTVMLPAGSTPTSYYKLQGGVWRNFTAHVTIVGDTVTLHLLDNDAFDTNPLVGIIGDPGAPADSDTRPPTVVCPPPPTFLLNQAGASITASVTDADPGPAAGTVTVPVPTGAVGLGSVAVTGSDLALNKTTVDCAYTVVFAFTGFSAPIDSFPKVNSAKAGQTIPVKWRITDANGVGISSPASFVGISSNGVGERWAGNSGLQYLGDGYWQFNWKTAKDSKGQSRPMRLDLADGVTTRVADFSFR